MNLETRKKNVKYLNMNVQLFLSLRHRRIVIFFKYVNKCEFGGDEKSKIE